MKLDQVKRLSTRYLHRLMLASTSRSEGSSRQKAEEKGTKRAILRNRLTCSRWR